MDDTMPCRKNMPYNENSTRIILHDCSSKYLCMIVMHDCSSKYLCIIAYLYNAMPCIIYMMPLVNNDAIHNIHDAMHTIQATMFLHRWNFVRFGIPKLWPKLHMGIQTKLYIGVQNKMRQQQTSSSLHD